MIHTVSGTTSCIPLIGHPVAQVRTPQPINRHFADRGIDAIMFPFDLAPARVADFFNTVRGWENCRGVSVTYPHKQAAFAQVDAATERARRVGAVNTIRRESDGRLLGEMTDGLAFVAALRATGAMIEGCRFLLVGEGGQVGGEHGEGEAVHRRAAASQPLRLFEERPGGLPPHPAQHRRQPGLQALRGEAGGAGQVMAPTVGQS
jgi:hypothetical protein